MAETVQVWSVFAYRDADGELASDERPSVTEPNLAACVESYAQRGFDNIYLHLTGSFECESVTRSAAGAHFWHGLPAKDPA